MRFTGLLIGVLICLNSCKNSTQSAANQAIVADQGEQPSVDFMQFYEQFHKDSLFQIEHIGWPLAGEFTTQVDSSRITKVPIEWQLSNWKMHRPIDLTTGEFQRNWKLFGDLMVTERIKHLQSGFQMERRFAKGTNGTWTLIFYSDI
jgi:hypothetical protein